VVFERLALVCGLTRVTSAPISKKGFHSLWKPHPIDDVVVIEESPGLFHATEVL
jgi:hypothetical protein